MRAALSYIVVLSLGASSFGVDTLEEQARQVVEEMGGPAALNSRHVAALSEEDRQILIRYHRAQLERLASKDVSKTKWNIESPQHRTDLLILGDPEMIRETVKTFLESEPGPSRDKAGSDLMYASRPETIAMLAPAIMVDEPYVIPPLQGDVGPRVPLSYSVANSLLAMMAKSPYFTDEVRKWAEDNSKVSPKKTMPMIRGWWRENEAALKAGTFRAVKPGIDLRAADLAAKAEINALQQKYREGLIAKGLSPADPANWKQWTEEIYPSLMASSQSEPSPEIKPTQPKPTVAVSTPPAKNEREGILYVSIGGGALIVMLAFLWVRFRRARS
jgi:hypothetical protein